MVLAMIKEIGGYFELERFEGESYHKEALELNFARNCLAYLAELHGISAIAIPDLLCDAVRKTCERLGISVRLFSIGEGMTLPSDLYVCEKEWLYLVDYYGRLTSEEVQKASFISGGRLIVDEAQGFFRQPWNSVDTIYTCRKFFGVADGAYLATRDKRRLNRAIPSSSSLSRLKHVVGRMELGANAYYGDYCRMEALIDEEELSNMSPATQNILRAIDYDKVKSVREMNYQILKERLDWMNLLETDCPEGPFMYPLQVEDARNARQMLASRGIYIPTLWPNVLDDCAPGDWAYQYAKNILPLPVDQRYDLNDMLRLAKEVVTCLK